MHGFRQPVFSDLTPKSQGSLAKPSARDCIDGLGHILFLLTHDHAAEENNIIVLTAFLGTVAHVELCLHETVIFAGSASNSHTDVIPRADHVEEAKEVRDVIVLVEFLQLRELWQHRVRSHN